MFGFKLDVLASIRDTIFMYFHLTMFPPQYTSIIKDRQSFFLIILSEMHVVAGFNPVVPHNLK